MSEVKTFIESRAQKQEVWYWPVKDEIVVARQMSPHRWLMYVSETRYYYYAITRGQAKANGFIKLGDFRE